MKNGNKTYFSERWFYKGKERYFRQVFMKPRKKYHFVMVVYASCKYGKIYELFTSISTLKHILDGLGSLYYLDITMYNIPNKSWNNMKNKDDEYILSVLNTSGYDKILYGCQGNVDYILDIERELKREFDFNNKKPERHENYIFKDGKILLKNKHVFKGSNNRINIDNLIKKIKG